MFERLPEEFQSENQFLFAAAKQHGEHLLELVAPSDSTPLQAGKEEISIAFPDAEIGKLEVPVLEVLTTHIPSAVDLDNFLQLWRENDGAVTRANVHWKNGASPYGSSVVVSQLHTSASKITCAAQTVETYITMGGVIDREVLDLSIHRGCTRHDGRFWPKAKIALSAEEMHELPGAQARALAEFIVNVESLFSGLEVDEQIFHRREISLIRQA